MKNHLSLVSREMRIKTMMRYCCISVTMICTKLTAPGASEDTEQLELWYVAGGNAHSMATLENVLAVSYKVKNMLTISPAILLLGIYAREITTYVHTKTCMRIFILALFIIAKAQRPFCWWVGELQYYSAIKKEWNSDIGNNTPKSQMRYLLDGNKARLKGNI